MIKKNIKKLSQNVNSERNNNYKYNILILTNPRSGSNHLSTMIQSNIGSDINVCKLGGEMLHPKIIEELCTFDNIISEYINKDEFHVVKIMYYQLRKLDISVNDVINVMFNNNPTKVIVLNRVNIFDQYLSGCLARANNKSWVNERYVNKTIINIDEYNFKVKNIKRSFDHYFENLYGIEYFKINYDNTFNNEDLDNLFDYLELDRINTDEIIQKQNIKSYEENILNLEELAKINIKKHWI